VLRRRSSRPRGTGSNELRKQRREEAEAARDAELDEWDALMYEAHSVTFEADMLAHRLACGLADLDEGRQFLADVDTTTNVYIDLSYLEHTCRTMELGGHVSPGEDFDDAD
jgi:hypothetical protein